MIFKPGTLASASGTVRRCSRAMSAAVMTVTELAMSRASVGIAVGLYTTVASASGAATRVRAAVLCGSLRWAAGRGRALGLETTTSGRFRSGDALAAATGLQRKTTEARKKEQYRH